MKFLCNKSDWSQVLAARVRRNHRAITYSIKSSIWSSVKAHFSSIRDNTQYLIGNGRNTNFWLDNWQGEVLAFKYKIPKNFHNSLSTKVSDYIFDNQWKISNNLDTAFPGLLHLISKVEFLNSEVEDSLVWLSNASSLLTMKHAYAAVTSMIPKSKKISFP